MEIRLRARCASVVKHASAARAAAWVTVAAAAVGAPSAPAQEAGAQATDHELEVYISEDAMQALYSREIDVSELDRTELRGGFFLNEARDLIGIGSLLTTVGAAQRQQSRWRAQFGPRVYAALLDNDRDVFGIGLGGRVSYALSSDRSTAASLSAWYAPDIVVFGEADEVTDVTLELQTRLTSSIDIFVGYRVFELDLDADPDREVDDGLHVGFRGTF